MAKRINALGLEGSGIAVDNETYKRVHKFFNGRKPITQPISNEQKHDIRRLFKRDLTLIASRMDRWWGWVWNGICSRIVE